MEGYRRIGLAILIILISTSGVVACSGYTVFGSVAGGALAVVTIAFWLLTATTQSGCTQACLTILIPEDAGDAGPLDARTDVGPCLTLDASGRDATEDAEVGVCLSQPFDAGHDAGEVGPCLSQPFDGGDDDAGDDDAEIGPCLSIAPDASEEPDAAETPDVASVPRSKHPALARRDAVARLAERGVLPADVAARLRAVEDEEA